MSSTSDVAVVPLIQQLCNANRKVIELIILTLCVQIILEIINCNEQYNSVIIPIMYTVTFFLK